MSQHPIEIILLRQWASHIAVPIWITDPQGNLVYCNELAEAVTGVHFDEEGDLPVETYAAVFDVCELDGSPMMAEDLPVSIALSKQTAAHRALRFRGLAGDWHTVEVTALPLIGQAGRLLGAMATFWEIDS